MKTAHILLALALFCGSSFAQESTNAAGWVVIPIRDYESLRARAFPAPRQPDPFSVAATLSRVDYDLRVDGPVAAGRAALTVDVLKDGWVRVPIPQGLLVRQARLNGDRVALTPITDRKNQLSAMLNRPGRSVLELDVAFTIATAGAEERLALPAGNSGVTRAAIALAAQDLEVAVGGGHIAGRPVAPAGTQWIAYATGREPLTFAWHKKMEERRVDLTPRLRGSLTQLFGLGEDSTSLSAEVEVEVLQGAANQVKIAVPDAVTINQVPGANVADWEVRNGELIVTFLDPVEKSATFTISGECRLARDGAIGIPLLRLRDAERETGGVAVEVLGAGEITNARAQGLEPAEAAEMGAAIRNRQSPSMAAFRLRAGSGGRSLNLEVARYDQQAVLTANIEEARYRVLLSADGNTLIQARYAVRNNQRNFAGIKLPEGASIWSATLAGRPVRPGKSPEGGLLFPLAKSRAGDEAPPFGIELVYSLAGSAWDDRGLITLGLPTLDLPVSRTGVVLYYPPFYRLSTEPGAFRVEDYERPASEVLQGSGFIPLQETANIPTAADGTTSVAQTLVDRYRATSNARRGSGGLRSRVSFPTVGPSAFLAAELTGEGAQPVIAFRYQQDKKGGLR